VPGMSVPKNRVSAMETWTGMGRGLRPAPPSTDGSAETRFSLVRRETLVSERVSQKHIIQVTSRAGTGRDSVETGVFHRHSRCMASKLRGASCQLAESVETDGRSWQLRPRDRVLKPTDDIHPISWRLYYGPGGGLVRRRRCRESLAGSVATAGECRVAGGSRGGSPHCLLPSLVDVAGPARHALD
jgi:hypothetical protein